MKAFGIFVSVLLIIFGAVFPIPKKEIRILDRCYDKSWFYEYGQEYWGGDSYVVEASLKSGWLSGILVMKSISVATGILLFFIIIYADKKHKELEKQTKLLEQLAGNQGGVSKNISDANSQKQPSSEGASLG